MNAKATGPREFTGRHMIALMAAFFGTVILVNLTLAWFAAGTWTGLVVKNSYVASQHYNQVLAEADAQTARGWRSRLDYGRGAVAFDLRDRHGNRLGGFDVTAKLTRPVHEHDDMNLVLRDGAADGRYRAQAALGAGQWQAEIVATGSDGSYRQVFRFIVPAGN